MKIVKGLVALLALVVVAMTASEAWAQIRTVYTMRMCSRLPSAGQRITCRMCVRAPRMVYDVPSNSCRPFGARFR